jgi:hypothetical protein
MIYIIIIMKVNYNPPKSLIENIFISKIKKNNIIPCDKIHKYWKKSRDEAILIMNIKYCIKYTKKCFNKIINFIINFIISFILLYIYCFIYILLY